MNSITWTISPNCIALALLTLSSLSLMVIAYCMAKNAPHKNKGVPNTLTEPTKYNRTYSRAKKICISVKCSELYKTIILTAWLCGSGYLMYNIYNNPILLLNPANYWSNIIAIIGIIVATLIGWQIYSAMDWNSKAERLAKIENTNTTLIADVRNVRSYAEASVLFIDALMAIAELGDEPNKKEGYQDRLKSTYTTLLQALNLYAGLTLEETIQNCLQYIEYIIDTINMYSVEMDSSFHEDCDELFEKLKSSKDRLTKAQWGSVQRIHGKRKGTFYAS